MSTGAITRLEQARRARGLEQRELAEAIGRHPSCVSRAEQGYVPAPEVRRRLAEALDVAERDLWREVGDQYV